MVYGTPEEQRDAAKRAHDLGITYFDTAPIVLKVLESGALSGASQPHPTSDLARRPRGSFADDARRARALRFLVRPGQTMVQAAIRFALQKPNIGVVLVGFSSVDQLEEAAAASTGEGLTDAEMARIEALYASDFLRVPA